MSIGATGSGEWLLPFFGVVVMSALVSAALIVLLRPLLIRYALARPSARGLHTVPTPQGGGIAVLAGCAVGAALGAWWLAVPQDGALRLAAVLAAASALALLGLIDDIRPLPALPRLLIQLALMAVGVAALPEGTRALPFLPFAVERVLLVVAGAWFINLTNFMDGMDWITVTEMLPMGVALALFWRLGALAAVPGLLALGLAGGLLGYAPSNKPPARLFLGDVGSLPIGFLVAYALFALAGHDGGDAGALAAAIILPLYYIADSGLTLMWRLSRREKVWEPHRSHFYQVAASRDGGPWRVLARIAAANLMLVVLAFTARSGGAILIEFLAAAGALVVVTLLLRALAGRDPAPWSRLRRHDQ